jgi:hypothetical protein
MLLPIVMVFLSLTLNRPVNRWANIVLAALLFLFNLVGLPTYPSAYDRFLIVVGLVWNVLTIWYAWRWVWLGYMLLVSQQYDVPRPSGPASSDPLFLLPATHLKRIRPVINSTTSPFGR